MKNNLIGISGKTGSGKNTVGKILQYLSSDKFKGNDTDVFGKYRTMSFKKYNQGFEGNSAYQIKKFTDKLKDIVCMLLGCTIEQLEDREFKEKKLGEEWKRYFVTKRGFITKSYIDKSEIKKYAESTDDLGKDYLVQSEILTPRKLLQLLGTECGRNIIHPNIWVNALFADYIQYSQDPTHSSEDFYPKWIITDVKFPNQAQAIKDRGGIVIRVNNPQKLKPIKDWDRKCPCCNSVAQKGLDEDDSSNWLLTYNCKSCGSYYKVNYGDKMGDGFDVVTIYNNKTENNHSSETSLDDYEFDYTINNNGTIEELIEKIKLLDL